MTNKYIDIYDYKDTIDIYDCKNIYNIYDKNNILESIKIEISIEKIYTIHINNEIYSQNNNYTLLFKDIDKKYDLYQYFFFAKTNYNLGFSYKNNSDDIYYIFDEFINLAVTLNKLYFNVIEKKNVYLYLYFYKYNKKYDMDIYSHSIKKNNIDIFSKQKYDNTSIIIFDLTSYILIHTNNKYNDIYSFINNNIIKIKLYSTKINVSNYDLVLCINIYECYKNNIIIILTPIKIIDDLSITIINLYNISEKCKLISKLKCNNINSKNSLKCNKDFEENIKKINNIFNSDSYYVKQSDIKNIIYDKFNISFTIKNISFCALYG